MTLSSLLACPAAGVSRDAAIVYTLSADFQGKYIWRGQNLNDRSVLQPAISVGTYGFTGSVWGNLDLTNKNDNSGEFSEFDYTFDYSGEVPDVNWLNCSVGGIYYRFPNTSYKPTTEVYGGLNFNMPLTPYARIYRDVDEINGSYLQFGIGHTFEKLVAWRDKCYCGLQIGASIGWGSSAYNKGYFGINENRFNNLTLSTGLPIHAGPWTIRPSMNYSMLLSNTIRSAAINSDNLWEGTKYIKEFLIECATQRKCKKEKFV